MVPKYQCTGALLWGVSSELMLLSPEAGVQGWPNLPLRGKHAVIHPSDFFLMGSCAVEFCFDFCSAKWVHSECLNQNVIILPERLKIEDQEAIAFRNGVALIANENARIQEKCSICARLKGSREMLLWKPWVDFLKDFRMGRELSRLWCP